MTQLLVKLLLAPTFVVGASLMARRYGPRVGGLVAGLPVVAGPIVLSYSLAHGKGFAADAAAGTLLGLVSLIAFVVVYGRLSRRLRWAPCMLCGWLAFAVSTAIFSAFTIPAGVALVLAATAIAGGPCMASPPQFPAARKNSPAGMGSTAAGRLRGRARADPDGDRRLAGAAAQRAARPVSDHCDRTRDVHPRAARI